VGGVCINIVIIRIVCSSLETFRFNLHDDMIGAFILTLTSLSLKPCCVNFVYVVSFIVLPKLSRT